MTLQAPFPPSPTAPRVRRGLRPWVRTHRPLAILVVATLVLVAAIAAFPAVVPVNVLIVPLLFGTLFLAPRQLAAFALLHVGTLLVATVRQPDFTPRRWVALAIIGTLVISALVISLRRARLGVGGAEGEALLVDLRDRIQSQGRVPALPRGWSADSLVRAAGGTPFSGDFFSFHSRVETRLDTVIVDVSGKGVKAGARALQLSGALNGLLGAVEPGRLLPAVNAFLLRQDWLEGFATAVYLSVDLTTGRYDVYGAGHPPPLVVGADGEVRRIEGGGPLLGLVPDAVYVAQSGELAAGESLVLYTDGLVESAELDLDTGIDELAAALGEELRSRPGAVGIAERVIGASGAAHDDRALLVLRRD